MMHAEDLFHIRFQSASKAEAKRKVGLLHKLTGVPNFLVYLEEIESPLHLSLSSPADLSSFSEQLSSEADKRTLQLLSPFFEEGGTTARLTASPLTRKKTTSRAETLLPDMIGLDRGLSARTGIHLCRKSVDCADLIVIPQASATLPFKEHVQFYQTLFELDAHFGPSFVLADLPETTSEENALLWTKSISTPNGASYFPWIASEGKTFPPAALVAAQFQKSDRVHGLSELPTNFKLQSRYRPRWNLSPTSVQHLLEHRVNTLFELRSAKNEREVRIWGGATLDRTPFSDYRYLSVRRTLTALQEAISTICETFVLEPLSPDMKLELEQHLKDFFQEQSTLFESENTTPYTVRVQEKETHDLSGLVLDCQFQLPRTVQKIQLSIEMDG